MGLDPSKDQIAEGVTIGGVDVGGHDRRRGAPRRSTTDARRAARASPSPSPTTARSTSSPERSSTSAPTSTAWSTRRSRPASEGGLPTRVWRYATGEEVDDAIEPKISYDKDAIDEFISHIADGRRSASPSTLGSSRAPSALSASPAQSGQTLESGRAAHERSRRRFRRPAKRTVAAQVEEVQPEVTTDEVADKYPTYLVVDRSTFTLTLYKDLKPTKTYTVAIGAAGFDTPAGEYNIQNKQVDPDWNVPDSDWAGDLAGHRRPRRLPENPLKARWMGIFDGAGIHGTDDVASLGSAASHGCVRMAIPDVIELYDQVDVGTPIYIG